MELVILVGVSGAGKSTMSLNYIKEGFIRINRDDLRKVLVKNLDISYYNRPDVQDIEAIVTHAEQTIAKQAVAAKKPIIIDNTNLHQKSVEYWISFANICDYKVSILILDVKLNEAKQRVKSRDGIKDEDTLYIDKQYGNFAKTKEWISKKYYQMIKR